MLAGGVWLVRLKCVAARARQAPSPAQTADQQAGQTAGSRDAIWQLPTHADDWIRVGDADGRAAGSAASGGHIAHASSGFARLIARPACGDEQGAPDPRDDDFAGVRTGSALEVAETGADARGAKARRCPCNQGRRRSRSRIRVAGVSASDGAIDIAPLRRFGGPAADRESGGSLGVD
ncbi:MAG: hypothetical protein ABSH51_16915 [Solirubrobacteraceae bacterium]